MIITVKTLTQEALEENEYKNTLVLEMDGKNVLSFWEGEPEDGTFGRNFNDVYKIADVLKMAYERGRLEQGVVIIKNTEQSDI